MQNRGVVCRVTRIGPASAFRTALVGCFAAYVAFVIMCVTLWGIASAFGVGENVENFFGNLVSSEDFHFLSLTMLAGVVVMGAALVVMGGVIGALGAMAFNLVAEMTGGVDIVSLEHDEPAPQPGPLI